MMQEKRPGGGKGARAGDAALGLGAELEEVGEVEALLVEAVGGVHEVGEGVLAGADGEDGGAGDGERDGGDGQQDAERDVDECGADAAERLAHQPGHGLAAGEAEHDVLLGAGHDVVEAQQEAAHGERAHLGG
ncbi:hypothetical protein [Nonomuraea salmonea]|uniref:hypothetical protein n=1 Tax=Nonomuraea salmonea TaxID=46181 RepID=UPI0031EDE1F5